MDATSIRGRPIYMRQGGGFRGCIDELTRHGHAHRIRAVVIGVVLAGDALDASPVVVSARFRRSRQRKRLRNGVRRL